MARIAFVLAAALLSMPGIAAQTPLFTDDFESGLGKWVVTRPDSIRLHASGDPAHGNVLLLDPGGEDVLAIIAGSEKFGAARIEGDVLFPTDVDNYFGVAYNLEQRGGRTDFGQIYIKGNDGYLQVNPHRDLNVGRLQYPEGRAAQTGSAAIVTGKWQRFALEVVGREAHFYVGDMTTPQLTFAHYEGVSGALALQPRSVGGPVWADNIRVSAIKQLSYNGPPRPRPITYTPERLLTDWQVLGPFDRTRDAVARNPRDPKLAWRKFAADARGAVITARVIDFHGPQTVAYFRTQYEAAIGNDVMLHLSTIDDLAVWINGRFHWFVPRGDAAWHDFSTNDAHKGQRIPISLQSGTNEIVIRVRGGVYASGAFFARIEP